MNILNIDFIKKEMKRAYNSKFKEYKLYKSKFLDGYLIFDDKNKKIYQLFFDYKWREDTFFVDDNGNLYKESRIDINDSKTQKKYISFNK